MPGQSEPRTQRPSRRHRLLRFLALAFVQLGALFLLLEVGATLVYPIVFDRQFSPEVLRAELEPRTEEEAGLEHGSDEEEQPISLHLLHPYVGYVRSFVEGERTNVFGYLGDQPILKRSPGRLNVALLGGSVALHMYRNAAGVLKESLAASSHFSGMEIDLVTLALPGYKQPQQLMALTYMLYLGAEYDVVINLDGFNELALPFGDNIPSGAFHHHPAAWSAQANIQHSAETIQLAAAMIDLRDAQEARRELFSSLRWSRLALFVWAGLDRATETRIRRLNAEYRAAAETEARPLGPLTTYEDDFEPYFREVTESWMRASLEMEALSGPHGFRYFHLLQPNQYVPGSKPLSAVEKRIAHVDGFPGDVSVLHRIFKWSAEYGYPHLRRAGSQLSRQGVEFIDLTMIFAKVRAPLYNDLCCHLNPEGYRRLARWVGRSIARRVDRAERRQEKRAPGPASPGSR